ncbi:prominin-1-A-like [Pseudophryne corroboree]|uniref:prominin-1-A-like n=1 Tax=Pseudophryne corroboree TaxID=495146 RepID=UPI003081B2BD
MAYQNLTNPVYNDAAAPENGTEKVFSDLVHSYLDLVQRNTFPPAFLNQFLKTLSTGSSLSVSNDQIKEVLIYEVGYLVALAIGVVFIILMCLVGFFFACCRCCGNCGGKMYQKQTKRMTCKRRFLYFFLFIITLIILAGDICMFYSNSKIDTAVNKSFSSFNDTLSNLETYINSVPQDVDIIINSSSVPIESANSSIVGIGPILGGRIKNQIELVANNTLASVQGLINDLNVTAISLYAVNNSFNALQDQQTQLVNNLTAVKSQIDNTLTSCGAPCSSGPSTAALTIDADFQSIPDFASQLKTINDFLNSGIENTLGKARQTINDIPQTVTSQTQSTVQSVQNQLVNIKQKIQDVRSSIPIVDTLNNVSSYFGTAKNYSQTYQPDVVKYDYYRWIVGICLSCIVLLVVVCNLCGLLFAPCGHKANVDPTERNCASNSAGDFFMAGAGFSFIFAWLLMLVTAVLFAVGGNVYTSFCKPWSNQQLYQFVDANVNLSQELNVNLNNLSISTLYSDCQKNYPLWTTLNLNSLFNLDEYLNISAYTGEVNASVENTNISVSDITFISSSQREQAANVSSSGIDTLNFTEINQQMSKNITKTNLLSFADQLDALAANVSSFRTELKSEADSLREIQSSIDTNLVPDIKNLNTSIVSLQAKAQTLKASLNSTLTAVDYAQLFITTQVASIVKNATTSYLNTILGYFTSYIDWTKSMLTTNLARCGPVAGALNSAEVIVCQYLVDTFNAFWFSLGWCTIFLIPSIIVSVKLAKHYRRMKTTDIYEDHNDHLEMTSTSQQFLIPRVTAKS